MELFKFLFFDIISSAREFQNGTKPGDSVAREPGCLVKRKKGIKQMDQKFFRKLISSGDPETAISEALKVVLWFSGLSERERKQPAADLLEIYLRSEESDSRFPELLQKVS